MTDDTRLFPNLDFEHEWRFHAMGQRYQRKRVMALQCERWSQLLRLVEGQVKGPLMWGLTPSVWDQLSPDERGLLPPLDAVMRVNHKGFSHRLERELGVVLPHACMVANAQELDTVLGSCPHPWILKHPWGVSGRDQVRGNAGVIDERHRTWALRMMKQSDGLIFEPLLGHVSEFSMHLDVLPSGEVVEIGACELMTETHGGTYRGNLCGPQVTAPDDAWDVARKVAQSLAEEGYFGPVGIDAMEGEITGQRRLRPLMEINARMSFGRLALALGPWVPAGHWYWWQHPAAKDSSIASTLPPITPDLPASPEERRYRLPEISDPGGQSGTFLVIGENAGAWS